MFPFRRFHSFDGRCVALLSVMPSIAGVATAQNIQYSPDPNADENMTLLYGLGLPDQILKKVYHETAEKIFAEFRGGRP